MAINIEKELNQKYSHPSNYETEAVFVDFIILSFLFRDLGRSHSSQGFSNRKSILKIPMAD